MNEIERAIKHFEGLQKRYTTTHNGKHCELVKTALAALREKRSIVYCKNCKYLGIKDFVYGYCKRDMSGQVQPDDYCSRGVRRKERHDE